MKHAKLVVNGLAVASLTAVVWFALPDDAQNAVKDTLGITQSAPTATVRAPGRTLDQVLTDWGKDTRTVINGHPVPPMPDPKINNATVAGVDSDKNGIRDDIDREIAGMDFRNQEEFIAAQAHARALQDLVTNPNSKTVRVSWETIECAPGTPHEQDVLGVKFELIERMTENTQERNRIASHALAGSIAYGHCQHK